MVGGRRCPRGDRCSPVTEPVTACWWTCLLGVRCMWGRRRPDSVLLPLMSLGGRQRHRPHPALAPAPPRGRPRLTGDFSRQRWGGVPPSWAGGALNSWTGQEPGFLYFAWNL